MKCGTPIDYIKLRRYKRLAREVIHEGGNLSEMARRAGVSQAFVSRYFRKHAPDLHQALKEGRAKRSIPPETILNRLRVISKARTYRDAGKILNLSANGVHYVIKRYAPDGIEEALEEYEATYGTPLFDNQPQEAAAVA